MGGSARKPDKPEPSYVDGKVRDPQIEELQRDAAKTAPDQRDGLRALVKKAATQAHQHRAEA